MIALLMAAVVFILGCDQCMQLVNEARGARDVRRLDLWRFGEKACALGIALSLGVAVFLALFPSCRQKAFPKRSAQNGE
jgi:hypothetical protein